MDLRNHKLELEYPCPWTYKLIGADEFVMRTVVAELMGEMQYALTYTRSSRTGRYCSLKLELVVESEEHRKDIFAALGHHPAIQAVL